MKAGSEQEKGEREKEEAFIASKDVSGCSITLQRTSEASVWEPAAERPLPRFEMCGHISSLELLFFFF